MADSWKSWYKNRMKDKFSMQGVLESENLSLTVEEAQKTYDELIKKADKLNPYEHKLFQHAQEVLYSHKRETSRKNISEADPGIINELWASISTMDPTNKAEVANIQGMLSNYGYYTAEVDSLYGGQTDLAIKEFQEDVSSDPKFTIDWIMDQAKNLFDIFD